MKLLKLILVALLPFIPTISHAAPEPATLTFQGGAIIAQATWELGPRLNDESKLRLEWKSGADRSALELSRPFEVEAFMPEMGHGSAPVRIEHATDAAGNPLLGVYKISQVFFLMKGNWELRVTLVNASGARETKAIVVAIAAGPSGQEPAPGSAFVTPSLAAICADGVTPHPKWAGFWHIDEPRFTRSAEALFATMDLRPNSRGEYAIVRIDQAHPEAYAEVARFAEPVRDIAYHDGQVWALFHDRIVALDPLTGVASTDLLTTSAAAPGEDYTAQAFAWAGNHLVIAHGASGTVTYDPATRSMLAMDPLGLAVNGQLSKAIDVTAVNDHQVAFAVEAVTVSNGAPWTFNGIIVREVNGAAMERFAYDRVASGVLSHARVVVAGDQVIINNWGILQRASLAAMRKSGSIQVSWTPVHFDVGGASQPGELLGDLLLDQGNLVSCAQTSYQDPVTHKVIHKGVVYSGAY